MKFTLYIDPECEEEIIIRSRAKTDLTEAIEKLVNAENESLSPLVGYIGEGKIVEIDPNTVYCFFIEDKRLFASTDKGDALIKSRLYEIEDRLGPDFIKINKSTIANLRLVDHFSVTIGTTLNVHFKNGKRDYVSRRQMKAVKERLGIK